MAVHAIQFQPKHALELVLYVAGRLQHPSFHSISKVLYFADREHLSRYGSLMTHDTYVAMRYGPVPSAIYNLLKAAGGRREPFVPAEWAELAGGLLAVEGIHRVRALRDANLEMISAAQRACLDASIKANGRLSFDRLARKSHDAAWKSADQNEIIELAAIAKTLPNAKEVLAYLSD
ncbi:MAG: Panacea domain-containing protein [Burkholderiales bacterium]